MLLLLELDRPRAIASRQSRWMATFGSRDTETTHGITEREPPAAVPIPQSCCLPLLLCPKPKRPQPDRPTESEFRGQADKTLLYSLAQLCGRTTDGGCLRSPHSVRNHGKSSWRPSIVEFFFNFSPFLKQISILTRF